MTNELNNFVCFRGGTLRAAAGFEGGGDCAIVQIIQLPPDGNAMGEARDIYRCGVEMIGDVVGGGLTINGCAEGEDDFCDLFVFGAR